MKSIVLFCFAMIVSASFAQNSYCSDDPPLNPWLADSPWPTFHRNNGAQASTCIAGPTASDELIVKARTDIKGGTSPWTYISDVYPSGERVMVQSNSTHFFKFIDTPEGIQTIDSLRIDFDPIQSFGFAFIQARDNKWFIPDPKYNPSDDEYSRIVKIEDIDPSDPYSEVQQTGEFSFEGTSVTKVNHLMLNFSGQLVFTGKVNEDDNVAHVGIIDQDLNVLDIFEYDTFPDEIVSHNSSPIETDNSWYLVTTHRLIKFAWDGTSVAIEWQAMYDFVNDGPTGSFAEGSGTTPTLMGFGDDEDKIVLVADGHSQNNLVAFWRELPEDWEGIEGQDIRFADSIAIPEAQASNNTFQSIENSPTVHDYSVAIAQFNGFLGYDCDNEKGVQKFTWDTDLNQWELDWVTNEINMNGVLTYSEGSNLVYSSGKESDCNYYLYGLNWDTGALDLRFLLGPEGTFLDDPFYDAGNNTIIDEDGNLFIPGGSSLFKVEKATNLEVSNYELNKSIILSPNPANRFIKVTSNLETKIETYRIIDIAGREVLRGKYWFPHIPLRNIPEGLYFLELTSEDTIILKRFIKRG